MVETQSRIEKRIVTMEATETIQIIINGNIVFDETVPNGKQVTIDFKYHESN